MAPVSVVSKMVEIVPLLLPSENALANELVTENRSVPPSRVTGPALRLFTPKTVRLPPVTLKRMP